MSVRVWVAGLALVLGLAATSVAADHTAATCGNADVQAAMNAATENGARVLLPTCTGGVAWSSAVTWNAPADAVMIGAGTSAVGGGDQTVILDNFASGATLLNVTTNASGTFRMTGLTFRRGTGSLKTGQVIAVSGSNHSTRIDHNHFDMSGYPSGQVMLRTLNWIYGVMDHNICDAAAGTIQECINVEMPDSNGVSWGDGSWANDTAFGTSNFFFVEDNIFNNGGYMNDCSQGGRVVVRHNTILAAKAQTHPTGSGPRFRGCRASEIYQNTFNGSPSCDGGAGFNNCTGFMFWASSGTLLIWGNDAPIVNANAQSALSFIISMHSMRRDNSTYGQTATPNGWGYCGTSFNGTGSNWDQNTSASTGYACLDQPGRGKGDLLSGDFPNVTNTALGGIAWPRQALEPTYEWLNTFTPVPNNPTGRITNSDPSVEVNNQDFYAWSQSFTGTSGVGTGLLSARPATCTPRVAFWATNTSTLYQCSSPNTWTAYYTPYTYPHPLTATPGTPPAPPRGLQIVQ